MIKFQSVSFLTYVVLNSLRKHTYLLTAWSRALLEKLTGSQLVKKFSAFYGTRRFITAFTSARHSYLCTKELRMNNNVTYA